MSDTNKFFIDVDYKSICQSIFDDLLRNAASFGNAPTPCGCADYGREIKNIYRLGDKEYTKLDDIPRADIHAWAKENGLKISNDGKTITCYKAVHKTDDGRSCHFRMCYCGGVCC